MIQPNISISQMYYVSLAGTSRGNPVPSSWSIYNLSAVELFPFVKFSGEALKLASVQSPFDTEALKNVAKVSKSMFQFCLFFLPIS